MDADVTQTLHGVVMGTAAYMSPEQAEGRPVDVRSDVFSFGAVLYEMISGSRAFGGTSALQMLNAVVRDEPPALQTSPALERIVRRCLQKWPSQRFQTMGELRAALDLPLTEPSKPIERVPSIAVLPFANMSADKENEYFSDGLAEEIINVLANVPGLKVAGRTSSFFFRGKDVEFAEIGKRLNVDHILEGSVRKAGSRIRVTAQLIKVADGFHLWSERYDRELTDVFAVQDEITARHRLGAAGEAVPGNRPAPASHTEPSRVRGVPQGAGSMVQTDVGISGAGQGVPRQGRRTRSGVRAAHFAVGLYYSMIASLGIRPTHEVIPLARAAVHEALRIDPSMPEAHALLGAWTGGYDDYDWHRAEQHWRLALAREPVSSHVRFWYGNHYLLPLGRFQEALDAMAKGLEGDPINLLYRHHFAVGLRHAGRFDEAEAELRRILELDENLPMAVGTLGALCAQQGRWDEALGLSEKASALTPWSHLAAGQLAALLVRTGETSRAETLVDGAQVRQRVGSPDRHGDISCDVWRVRSGSRHGPSERSKSGIRGSSRSSDLCSGPVPGGPPSARMMNLPESPSRGGSERGG